MNCVIHISLPDVTYNVLYHTDGRTNPFVIFKIEESTGRWEEVTAYADLSSCMCHLTDEIRERYNEDLRPKEGT